MITIAELDTINVVNEDDLSKINIVLLESFLVNNFNLNEEVVIYKENIIDGFMELLKKMMSQNSEMSKESRLIVIKLLDKLNVQKENLEIIKLKTDISDIRKASERLSKKSQSAFQLK